MVTAADASEVRAAVRRAAALNPLFALALGPPDTVGWRPASELADQSTAAGLVTDVGRSLGTPPARVAASMVVLGYSARLVAPAVAVLVRDGVLLGVAPGDVWWRFTAGEGFQLRLPAPSGSRGAPLDQWSVEVIDRHLGPLVAAVRAAVPVAKGLLWGNVASSLAGALRFVALSGAAPLPACHETGLALLRRGPLRGSGQLSVRSGQLRFVRRSCCLYYRLPGGGTCGDCPLRRTPLPRRGRLS